ncbi:phage tail length tape measure family protein [Pseudomonas putida]|uniref:phage tail length tape measure family protein n=1 Tax=Pseudomonas putida TaxID=303 RepID=UPI0018D68589|nr:phage tail length tape measure family protein [Pseudomonas putida]MBH3449469.1 phage tail length tape measure family protein [Pseudomonas putida]
MTQESRLAVTIDSRGAKRNADDLTGSLERMERAGDGAASSADGLSSSLDDQRKELSQLLGQINPTVAALGRLDDMQEKLAKFKKAGIVESETFVEYTQRINTMRDALGNTAEGMNKAGMSARAYQAALRGLPAQFTDIAVSLQGGQAPLTVFLQQGGQLKDMFGGVGPAARAMGGYILGLVNPFTLAASAAGVFAIAAYKGYEQSEAYRKALISTGEAAGKTSDQLSSLSLSLAGGRNFTQANQAVMALAGNGRLVGSVFDEVARAATELSAATGKSSADIADQLSSTKGSVSELAAEYSGKYGVITQAVYNQVRSLERQGQRMEAIRVLSGAVADEMTARNKEMIDSTRGLAKAWDGVKTSIVGAWNELKTGLSASPELFKLQHLQSQLQTAREIGDKALIKGLEQQVELAQKAVDAQQERAKVSSAQVQSNKVAIASSVELAAFAKDSRTQTQRLNDELEQLNRIRDKAKENGGFGAKEEADYAKARKNIEQEIADIKAREAKKNAPKNVNRGVAEAENTFARLYGQYDPAAQAARALTKEQGQLDLALSKGKITQEEYSKALAQASTNYAAALKGAQGLTAVEQYRAQLQRQLVNEQAQYQLDAASIGMGDLQASRMQQRLNLEMQTNDRLLQLQTELANATDEKQRQALQGQIDAINEFLPQQIAAMQAGWAQIDQAMLNPINGWTAAVQNFGNQARDIAGQTEYIFSSAFNNISTDITDAIMDGQLSFSNLGDIAGNVVRDILAGFVKMGVQMALNAALNATLGTAAAGQSMILAGTTATAWAPAAAMASLATLGANSVPAAAALTSTTALASSLAVIPGFATGGYVSGAGTGTSDSIMARLSDGEFVVNAAATKRNRALLEAINSNERVSVAGGGGSAVTTQSSAQGGGAQTSQVIHQVTIENYSQSQVETRTDPDGRLRVLVQAVKEQIADEFAAGYGPVVDAGEAAYGWKRNPY